MSDAFLIYGSIYSDYNIIAGLSKKRKANQQPNATLRKGRQPGKLVVPNQPTLNRHFKPKTKRTKLVNDIVGSISDTELESNAGKPLDEYDEKSTEEDDDDGNDSGINDNLEADNKSAKRKEDFHVSKVRNIYIYI